MAAASMPGRRVYLDWLRGIAVLLMIEVHIVDSWTAVDWRQTPIFHDAVIVGGMGSALFLLLAGVAAALSAGSKLRRTGSAAAAANAVVKRGLQVFALAFLFRLQEWILGWSPNPRDLLKVDILNIMGPSIALTAILWRLGGNIAARCVVFAAATALVAILSALNHTLSGSRLPDPIEAYFVPVEGLSNFVFFPWMGLVFAGAFAGVLIDAVATTHQERRLNIAFGAAGAALTAAGYAASYLPDQNATFWTTSWSFLVMRIGIGMIGIAAAYAWTAAALGAGRWSPLAQMGRASLFIYWIHVEIVYGLISRPWHRGLPLHAVGLALVALIALMLGCAVVKERVETRTWLHRGRATAAV
jgi:uncharacterized membrane protein